jgi:hypothetical protein
VTPVWRADEWADPTLSGRVAGPHVGGALALAAELAPVATSLRDRPGRYLWTLATLGAGDLTVARAAEPHLDAVAILAQAGSPDLGAVGADGRSTFGVFAAGGPGGLHRTNGSGDGPRISGTKPWCSLADTLTHALVTVGPPDRPELHAVPLRHPGVTVEPGTWVPRGLTAIRTATLHLEAVPSVMVGPEGWYLSRPGFSWGGIGVAAVWFGAAAALAGSLVAAAAHREPDQVARLHLGRVDLALHGCLLALRDAAVRIQQDVGEGALLAQRVRALVAEAAEQVIVTVGHALGPAPLTHDDDHARRVADLTVYLRQHHAERDLARLGALVLEQRPPDREAGS